MIERFAEVRAQSLALVAPLEIEDFGVQPMEDASPPKWHLAHTTWFFETFLLKPLLPGYQPFHPQFEVLFNSYYNGVGEQFPRPRRGHLSRPTVEEVLAYRSAVEQAMAKLLEAGDAEVLRRTELGLHHEQQHQELMLTDLKFNFGHNPLLPAYRADLHTPSPTNGTNPAGRLDHEGGIVAIGADGGFAFDNETPRHETLLRPFQLADRLVTNGEYLDFMEDEGYQRSDLWLSDGWTTVRQRDWQAPLYWREVDGAWHEYTLAGSRPLAVDAPVTHLSGYEADAFARWSGARLPTEAEWEAVAESQPCEGNFVERDALHPEPCLGNAQFFGDAWEWTSSAYGAYPGYRPLEGALGEYNGKFMANQLVLRGGSCATPSDHIRPSYRNFFYPPDRWQFTGVRLAYDG